MTNLLFFHRLRTAFVISFIVSLAACHKDDKIAGPGIGTDPNGGKDTITLGSSVRLSPTVTSDKPSTYAWMLDGSVVSTDSAYTFVPADRGDYSVSVTVSNPGGSASQSYDIHVYGRYENGFFLANEGWYGHGGGTLGFYRYDTQTLEDSIFSSANPGKDLGPVTSTLEYGTVFNNRIYLSTKAGGPLVQLDGSSLKETGRIATAAGNDFRALLPIDSTVAIVGTSDGLFSLNLQTMVAGAVIPGVTGEAGDMLLAGNYIFVLTGNDGLDILNKRDYSVAKNIPGLVLGLTKSMDGSVWAAGGDSLLVRIDVSSLDTGNVKLPFEVNGSFGFWHPGSITASAKENSIFIAYNSAYSGATSIYKYVPGNAASLAAPFIQIANGKELYGSGLAYDAAKDLLIVSTVGSGFGDHYSDNNLVFYSPADGSVKKDNSYSGFYFPAMAFFR